MGILSKLRQKLRRPREDLRDYEEIERVQEERNKLKKLREKIFQEEKEKVLKEKWRKEARKKAEREAYGFFTPSRKAAIVSIIKNTTKTNKIGHKKTKRGRKSRSEPLIVKTTKKKKQKKPRSEDIWRMI